MKHTWTRGEAWGKSTAALLGGFVGFLLFGLALGSTLPLIGVPIGVAVSIAVVLSVPMWAALILWAVLAENGRRAWLRVGVTSLVLGALIALATFL
ncbi:MAG: hypothetical protein AAF624_10750 [Bacteroidota bacterium]